MPCPISVHIPPPTARPARLAFYQRPGAVPVRSERFTPGPGLHSLRRPPVLPLASRPQTRYNASGQDPALACTLPIYVRRHHRRRQFRRAGRGQPTARLRSLAGPAAHRRRPDVGLRHAAGRRRGMGLPGGRPAGPHGLLHSSGSRTFRYSLYYPFCTVDYAAFCRMLLSQCRAEFRQATGHRRGGRLGAHRSGIVPGSLPGGRHRLEGRRR